MKDEDKKRIAESFLAGLRGLDAEILGGIMTEDVTSELPGESLVSGVANGVSGIINRARTLAKYKVSIALLYILYGRDCVAIQLHNTGSSGGRVLDEHLTTVLFLREGRAWRLVTAISDVPMLNAYFS